MGSRRMISDAVFYSNRFVGLHAEAKVLYTYMILCADDDGVVNSSFVAMLMASAKYAHLAELEAAGLLIKLDDAGEVWAIKHWLVQNAIDAKYYKHPAPAEYRDELRVRHDKTYSLADGMTIDEYRQHRAEKFKAASGGKETGPISDEDGDGEVTVWQYGDIDLTNAQVADLTARYGDNLDAIIRRISQYVNQEGDVKAKEYSNLLKLADKINDAIEGDYRWPSNAELSKLIYADSLAAALISR